MVGELGSRTRFLEAAATVAASEPPGEPAFGHLVSHVKLSDVAERLALSRAALYKLWPTQHEYWVDLAAHLITEVDEDPWIVRSTAGLTTAIDPTTPDLLEGVRTWFNEVEERLVGDPRLVLRSASLAYQLPEDVARRRTELERRDRAEAARHLRSALAVAGRRPVPSLTVDDLTLAIAMLVDGSAMLNWTAPKLVIPRSPTPLHDDRPWSALAFAVRCLLEELTEPGVVPQDLGADDTLTLSDDAPRDVRPSTPARLRALGAGQQIIADLIAGEGPESAKVDDHSDVLGHVTMQRVARAAGVSRRHLYNVWGSQAEFQAELHGYLSRREFEDYFADFDDAALHSALSLKDPRELALTISELVNEEPPVPEGRAVRSRFAFRGQLTDPGVRGRMRRTLEAAVEEQALRLAGLADLMGIEFDAGLDGEQVSLLLLGTAGGSERMNRIDPVVVRTKLPYRNGEWSLFSIICQAIISRCVGTSALQGEPPAPG